LCSAATQRATPLAGPRLRTLGLTALLIGLGTTFRLDESELSIIEEIEPPLLCPAELDDVESPTTPPPVMALVAPP